MWSLADPAALLLLPLPFLAARLLRPAQEDSGAVWVPPGVATQLQPTGPTRLRDASRRLLPALLWGAMVLALAGPRMIAPTAALVASGRDIILAIDLSGSMEQEDFDVNGAPARRLDAVKQMAAEFVRGRQGDRVGLVVFSEKAYFAAPPTYDIDAVVRAVEEVTIGISGRNTSISEGLGLALKRLEQSPAKTRVVILLSDGINTSGAVAPTDAADYARRINVRVHTIALGPRDTSDLHAGRDVVDAEALGDIAQASGGTTFRVRRTADLEAVGRSLDALEPNRARDRASEVYRELWAYPAVLAFLASVALLLLPRRAG